MSVDVSIESMIYHLLAEAVVANNERRAKLCRDALAGSDSAWAACERILRDREKKVGNR